MPEPLFTAVDYEVTQREYAVRGLCTFPFPEDVVVTRTCVDGFYFYARGHAIQHFSNSNRTRHLPLHPHDDQDTLSFDGAVRHVPHKPPDGLDVRIEWFDVIHSSPVPYYYPPPPYPEEWIASDSDPVTGYFNCLSNWQVRHTIACIDGLLRVTKHIVGVQAFPLPNKQCRKLRWVIEKTVTTSIPCEASRMGEHARGANRRLRSLQVVERSSC